MLLVFPVDDDPNSGVHTCTEPSLEPSLLVMLEIEFSVVCILSKHCQLSLSGGDLPSFKSVCV